MILRHRHRHPSTSFVILRYCHSTAFFDILRQPSTSFEILRIPATSISVQLTPVDILRYPSSSLIILRHPSISFDILRHISSSFDIIRNRGHPPSPSFVIVIVILRHRHRHPLTSFVILRYRHSSTSLDTLRRSLSPATPISVLLTWCASFFRPRRHLISKFIFRLSLLLQFLATWIKPTCEVPICQFSNIVQSPPSLSV
jgi:hypothetical protein